MQKYCKTYDFDKYLSIKNKIFKNVALQVLKYLIFLVITYSFILWASYN